jgi:mono/diheme cytochrome c family protein
VALVLALLASGALAAAATQRAGAPAQDTGAPAASARPESGQTERGRYLAHHVAMCVQCHSPRDRTGELLGERLFEGGPVPVESPFVGPRWAFMAPSIQRVPGYTEVEFVRLLGEGVTRNGTRPLPPMPPFRMTEEDARAIWSYLRSLRPES